MLAIRPFGMQVTATRLEYSIRVRRSEDERGRLRCRYPGRMIVSESGVRPHALRGRALTVAASRGVGAGSARQSHGRRARIPPAARCYEGDCARARFRKRRSESPCGRREVRRTAGTWELDGLAFQIRECVGHKINLLASLSPSRIRQIVVWTSSRSSACWVAESCRSFD